MKNYRYVRRIDEILASMPDVLNEITLGHFNSFRAIYAANVQEGLELLEKFRFSTDVESVIQTIQCSDYQNLTKDTKLSIFEQLMQIAARWRVHKWVMGNHQVIAWLNHRSGYYPVLLAKYAQAEISENKTLPKIDIAWLIELVTPLLQGENRNRRIAEALSDPQYHDALLQFSAQLDRINTMLQYIQQISQLESLAMFKFVQSNRDFFKRLVVNNNSFRVPFARYVRANAQASQLLGAISGHLEELQHFLSIQDYQSILTNIEMYRYLSPLLNLLLSGFLNGRLAMLIEFSNISSTMSAHHRQYLETLTWCEQYRDILALSFSTNLEWHKWIIAEPQHNATIKAYSEGLAAVLNEPNVVDVRDCKLSGEADKFPSPMSCFIDCIIGLSPQDRFGSISCVAHDVLLYQFLSHAHNHQVLSYLHENIPIVTPVIEAFKQSQKSKLNQLMILALSEPLPENANSQEQVKRSVPTKLPKTPKKKTRKLVDENEHVFRMGY